MGLYSYYVKPALRGAFMGLYSYYVKMQERAIVLFNEERLRRGIRRPLDPGSGTMK